MVVIILLETEDSVSNAFNTDLLWTHWGVDSLRAQIQGYNSVIRTYETGLSNITIPAFSMNTCIQIILGDANQDEILNVIDIIMIVNYILDNIILSEKELVISDINVDDLVNITDIIEIVNIILE